MPINIYPRYPFRIYFDYSKNEFWEWPWSIPIIALPYICAVFEKSMLFITMEVVFKDDVAAGTIEVYTIPVV